MEFYQILPFYLEYLRKDLKKITTFILVDTSNNKENELLPDFPTPSLPSKTNLVSGGEFIPRCLLDDMINQYFLPYYYYF